MDPFSAILLIGLVTVATVKSAGSAVTDGLAQAKGQTPPSLEKWRANQEKKRERGEQPREDPGGLKRIWANQMEYLATKSAKKHQGKLEYLDRHGPTIAEGKRKRMERADRRREYLGSKFAAAGGSSWGALKTAAQKAAEAKRAHAERKTETERRGAAPAEVDAESNGEDSSGPDATVLSFTRRRRGDGSTEVEVNPGGDGSSNITGDPADPLTWRGTDSRGRDIQTGDGDSYIETLPDGSEGVVHDTDTYRLRKDETPERRIVLDAQRDAEAATDSDEETAAQKDGEDALTNTTTDPEKDTIIDPDTGIGSISIAELLRRRERQAEERRRADEEARRAHESAEAQAEREHRERLAEIQAQQSTSSTETGGEAMSMPQSSATEITDLATAQQRAKESQQYAGKVQTVLQDQLDSLQAAIKGMQAEAQTQEGGSGSLSGEGFTSRITGKFDAGAEAFNNAVAALEKQVQAAQAAIEEVGVAAAEMKTASAFFDKQQGLADSIGAVKQDGGVSKRTDFYANSGA